MECLIAAVGSGWQFHSTVPQHFLCAHYHATSSFFFLFLFLSLYFNQDVEHMQLVPPSLWGISYNCLSSSGQECYSGIHFHWFQMHTRTTCMNKHSLTLWLDSFLCTEGASYIMSETGMPCGRCGIYFCRRTKGKTERQRDWGMWKPCPCELRTSLHYNGVHITAWELC